MEQLLAGHVADASSENPQAGNSTEVQQLEVHQALAGHQALQAFLAETTFESADDLPARSLPELPEDYRIQQEIGHGGMGVVYLAHQHSLHRDVALKVLRPGEHSFGPMLKRFLGEAKHLARLRHPNIVAIHEVGDAGGEPYFTMDYIDGEPLSAMLQRGPLAPSQSLSILKQVALGVQHAHRQGIIHRDLKPSNVLIDREGRALVTDFGLARDVHQASDLTQSGELLGTPQYMAPEQARGQASLIGEATDIHALGLLLFEMLTGQAAFASDSAADVLVRLLHEEPPSLRSIDRRIPRDLETICLKMLQKSPAARYTNISSLLEDIRRFEAGEPLVARRTGVATRALRWCHRHWQVAVAVAVGAVLAIGITAPLFDQSFQELVAWGDEELATGNADVAGQIYLRALKNATNEERLNVIDRIVQTTRSMEDAATAVELAMAVLADAPDASFGRYDYLVAQTLIAREGADANLGTTNIWQTQPEPILKLVKNRLMLALRGELSDTQRRDAEQVLANVNRAIHGLADHALTPPGRAEDLPKGTEAELQQKLEHAEAIWDRGKAGIALGKLHEQAGRIDQAVATYRQAYELIRRVYPMVGGVKEAIGSRSLVNAPDAKACQLVQELVVTLNRLAPESFPLPTGAIEFEVTGSPLPRGVHVELMVELADPAVRQPDQGLRSNLPRLMPLRQDQPVRAEVLDGRYRLRYRGNHVGGEATTANDAELLEIDVEDWPETIEVRGETVKLPPVVLRRSRPVELELPPEGEPVDLSKVEFRWSPIPQADHYQVQFEYRQETPTPSAVSFLNVEVKTPRLRLSERSDRERAEVRKHLVAGRTGAWTVDAYDAEGKRIGRTLEARRFLVATEWTE